MKFLVNIWFCLTVTMHLGPTDLCKHFRLYWTGLVHLPCGFMIFPFVRGILFPMGSMLVCYVVLIMPQQTYVGNNTDFDDEPDGENPGGVQKGLEAVVLHPEQAGSRHGVVLALWQSMAFVAVL